MHQSRNNPDVMALITPIQAYVSTDHGATWDPRPNGLISGGALWDIHVHPDDPNIMLVTLSTYSSSLRQVYKTTDMGLNWFPIDEDLPNEPCNTIAIDPSHTDWYFLGTDMAVYVSFNAGVTWTPLNIALPHVVMEDLRIHDSGRFIRVGTHGRGMWELDISGLGPSSVDADQVVIQPLTLRVLGNPASNSATLHFGLREAGRIHLGLYDVSGRLVRTVADREALPVTDNVDVDLSDLPAGVYFARLDANGASVSKKVVVER
jgi:hypothetical protein